MRQQLFRVLCAALWLSSCADQATAPRQEYRFPDANVAPDSILEAVNRIESQPPQGPVNAGTLKGIYMGLYYNRKGSYRQARKEFGRSLEAVDQHTPPVVKCRIYLGLGNAAKNLAEYPEALKMFSEALRHSGTDSLMKAGIHGNIAQAFQLHDDPKQAIVHLNEARAFSGSHVETPAYLKLLHTLANVYGMSGNTDSALMLDAEGLAIARRINAPAYESSFLDNKANCFMYTSRPDSARWYLRQSMRIDSVQGDVKQMSDTWMSLGYLEDMQGRPAQAVAMIHRGIRLADSCGYRNGAMEGWKALAALHEKAGAYQLALQTNARYHGIRDSIADERKDAAVAEWKAVYETSRKEDKLRVQALQLRQQRQTIWGVSVSCLLLLGGGYYAYRRTRLRKERRYREVLLAREQEAAREIVVAEEAERKRIAADLHDGIGQTLTAAWLNLQAVQPKLAALEQADADLLGTTMKLVGESCAEIRQISHNMMPAMLLYHGLIPAMQELVSRLHDARLDASLSVDMGAFRLEKGTELIVYRIIQECVNNVVRHAQATAIYISITADETELALMIEDNGKGVAQNLPDGRQGMGMQNIRSRVHYLHGSVEWSSASDGAGTLVAIHIPTNP